MPPDPRGVVTYVPGPKCYPSARSYTLEAPPLAPVRSLHYFLPMIDEIRQQAIDPGYISYAEWKVRNADQELDRIRRTLAQPPSTLR